ncbi:MAG: hypothetical protein AB3N18_06750 [Allomuricauda sp.]
MKKTKSWSRNLNWEEITGTEREEILERVNPIDGKYKTNVGTKIMRTNVSFYNDNVFVLCLTNPDWKKNLEIYYFWDSGNLFRLNGTSPPIHEVNAKAPIKLDKSNVIDYLRFFCFFVHAENGPFLLFETIDQLEIPLKLMSDKEVEILKDIVYTAKLNNINNKGNFLVTSMVWHYKDVFAARFEIQKSGMIEMLEDETVVENLSQKPIVLLN